MLAGWLEFQRKNTWACVTWLSYSGAGGRAGEAFWLLAAAARTPACMHALHALALRAPRLASNTCRSHPSPCPPNKHQATGWAMASAACSTCMQARVTPPTSTDPPRAGSSPTAFGVRGAAAAVPAAGGWRRQGWVGRRLAARPGPHPHCPPSLTHLHLSPNTPSECRHHDLYPVPGHFLPQRRAVRHDGRAHHPVLPGGRLLHPPRLRPLPGARGGSGVEG